MIRVFLGTKDIILPEVAPQTGDPLVSSSVDKFYTKESQR